MQGLNHHANFKLLFFYFLTDTPIKCDSIEAKYDQRNKRTNVKTRATDIIYSDYV